MRPVADLAQYEADENPDGGEVNSNPNSVLALPGRRYVVDAGGNDLLRVGPTGRISTVAVFPPQRFPPDLDPPAEPEFDAVPTAVVRGPDRALYVSQLTGFPFIPGAANIYRVERNGDYEVYAKGYTNVTDLAFGPDGSLYVVEFATNGILSGDKTGALKRVVPGVLGGEIISDGLVNPTGVAVSRQGHIYVSNNGAVADDGEVVRGHTD